MLHKDESGESPTAVKRFEDRRISSHCERLRPLNLSGRRLTAGALIVLTGCVQYIAPPSEASLAQRFAEAERLYADARDLYFKAEVTQASGTGRAANGVPLEALRVSYGALRERALERLEAIDANRLGPVDRRAWEAMHRQLGASIETGSSVPCAATDAGATTLDALSASIGACYRQAQSNVVVRGDTLDRLTVLARLANDTSAVRRREAFLALRPVWESANGTNTPGQRWRRLIAMSAERWRLDESPVDGAATSLGFEPGRVEALLTELLDAWRDRQPERMVEPWDWWFVHGAASRRLLARLPLGELERVNEAYYASFGASPRALGIVFDLAPRAGKPAVAFTQFGGLPREGRDGPRGADPRVFATYREGGFGNLVELLHETGHAVHIAAVATRPAFADWPDSDPFTEALADVPALEAYEPAWQVKFLGDSASTGESLREKYAGVMMDVAWALFELRMHRDPGRDPNAVWADITGRYLQIAPHTEWSWWALRGQLVESPGYMVNYALGAIVAADVRERVREQRGGFMAGAPKLYPWLAGHLYRFGRSRRSRDVLEGFLGRPPGVAALRSDLARIGR
ncbi:MAG: hypothetical protein IT361_09970 [Gemmatimonadaceae bacterium]|nr:hypothetical protein [Gemmatimonadaceae bacterium]